jgi:hypothetical protein
MAQVAMGLTAARQAQTLLQGHFLAAEAVEQFVQPLMH